jgi:hypothetical protein
MSESPRASSTHASAASASVEQQNNGGLSSTLHFSTPIQSRSQPTSLYRQSPRPACATRSASCNLIRLIPNRIATLPASCIYPAHGREQDNRTALLNSRLRLDSTVSRSCPVYRLHLAVIARASYLRLVASTQHSQPTEKDEGRCRELLLAAVSCMTPS